MNPRTAIVFIVVVAATFVCFFYFNTLQIESPAQLSSEVKSIQGNLKIKGRCKNKFDNVKNIQQRVHKIVLHANKPTNFLDPFHLNNVVAVDVIHASIPRSHYVIDEYNCSLDIRSPSQTGDVVSISLVKGDSYNAVTLAQSIQEAVCCQIPEFTVNFSQHDSKYTFVSKNSFDLLFSSGPNASTSLFRELGFHHDDYFVTNNCAFSLTSPFRSDLTGSRYVHVHLPQLEKVHPEKGFLAQIPLLPPHPFGVLNNLNESVRQFPNILLKSGLQVNLVEVDPRTKKTKEYLLNGMYFSLTLRVVCLEKALTWQRKLTPLKSNTEAIY